MLTQLRIRDFAIVEALDLELAAGMTAVTGETGAGKSILVDAIGLLLLITPASRKITWLNIACVTCFVGIWIEKGMGLIIPGFVPSPLGQVVEYLPTINETLVCLGIWAFGVLMFSWMLHVAIPIMNGALRANPELAPTAP